MRNVFASGLIAISAIVALPSAAQTLTELGVAAEATSATPSPVTGAAANPAATAAPAATAPAVTSQGALSSKSLFFNSLELAAIQQAKRGYIAPQTVQAAQQNVIPSGPRSLKLAGIVYNSENDWVIWFNGERVHPKNLPENMKNIVVRKDRIAVRWHDVATNKIISVVLFPHQQYHIDSDTITLGTR